MAEHRSGSAARLPYLVVRTSQRTAALPDRCAAWANRTGADVEVVGPVGADALPALLDGERHAGIIVEVTPVRHDAAAAALVARAQVPVVTVNRDASSDDAAVEAASTSTISGRGTSGFLWALGHLHALCTHPPTTVRYGDHDAQTGDLRLAATPHAPVVMLVHGGFWRHEWGRDLMDGLALDLSRRGYATWNIEYRRVGPTGGGWPRTGHDVVRAVTELQTLADGRVDVDRVVLVGHSAGAQLALRAAEELRTNRRPPSLVVSLSGLFDLEAAARDGVGWGSVEAFLGGDPSEVPGAYRAAAPIAHLPLRVPQMVVHGIEDAHVPPTQSDAYVWAAATAGE
ncbi:MAG TPA: alpha/beta hydrolase, partial [Euzebyales bacterium]|nr:alpha/beta hydrolase [Euzebyales bacterium]